MPKVRPDLDQREHLPWRHSRFLTRDRLAALASVIWRQHDCQSNNSDCDCRNWVTAFLRVGPGRTRPDLPFRPP